MQFSLILFCKILIFIINKDLLFLFKIFNKYKYFIIKNII